MRKTPCLFVRIFEGPRAKEITRDVTPGCEWVLAGEGAASVKWDGSACLVQNGALFKRYDFKAKVREKGGQPPAGFVPCQPEPDPVTGHHPGWVPVLDGDHCSKWHYAAWCEWQSEIRGVPSEGTYELCGPHFQANPHGFGSDVFMRHGAHVVDAPRTFDALRAFLEGFEHEGVVFAHADGRMAKIRRDDFGFAWPMPKGQVAA